MKTNKKTIKNQTQGSSSTAQNFNIGPNHGTPDGATISPRTAKRRRNRDPQPITPEDLKKLLETVTDLRDRALLLILMESRLPAGYISRMNLDIKTVTETLGDGSQVVLGRIEILSSTPDLYRPFSWSRIASP